MICRTGTELIDPQPHRAFISYAHVETPWRDRLVEALVPLQIDGFIEAWHDGMLRPGDEWHAHILNALADADLVLLLVSRALLESKYAGETEIPFAVERALRGKVKLVPVILDSCDWTKMPFAKYQALPGDRIPIAELDDVDSALNDCLERLRLIFAPDEAVKFRTEGVTASESRPLLRLTFEVARSGWPNWSAMIDELRRVAHNADLRTNQATRLLTQEDTPPGNRWEWLLEGPPSAFQP